MATVTLTSHFANLSDWAGLLLEPPEGSVASGLTSTSATLTFPATGTAFPNFKITITGSGFEYLEGVPIGGTMSSVSVFNASNQLVIRFAGLSTNAFVSDFSGFSAYLQGSSGDTGPGTDPAAAWSQLMAGNDIITGTAGNDWSGLAGVDGGDDVYNMGTGDDWVFGGMGNDTVNGGDGFDSLSYGETTYYAALPAIRGISVNLQTGIILDAWGGTDTITSIESVVGSRFRDTFVGNASRNEFAGLRGADSFDGGVASYNSSGQRTGDHRDTVSYDQDYFSGGMRGIIVDLETSFVSGSIRGTIRDGFGNLDTVRDIERVNGTRFNDIFVGSRENNVFRGGEGVDSYSGEGGFDRIDFDRWFGDSGPTFGVNIDLRLATGQIRNDGFGNIETMTGIEAVRGTHLGDVIRGSTVGETFSMGGGADTLTGGGGVDYFEWWDSEDMKAMDRIIDFNTTGPGADVLGFDVAFIAGMTGTLTLVNGTAATTAGVGTFIFNAANEILYWDADGMGGASAKAIARLFGVTALTTANFELYL